MRICYVIPSCNPARGGEQKDALTSALALSRIGHEVTILTGECPSEQGNSGVAIKKIHYSAATKNSKHLCFTQAASFELAKNSWEVVEGFSRVAVGNVSRVGAGSRERFLEETRPFRSCVSAWRIRLSSRHRFQKKMETQVYSRPNTLFVANSRKTADELVSVFSIPASRIFLVYPGTDISFFSPDRCELIREETQAKLGIKDSDFIMAFVGSGFFRKGLPQAISFVSKLKRQGIKAHLLVAGRDRTSRFSRMAREETCQAEVHFLGQVDNILSIYAASDLLLLPSLYEPYGLSPLEAMSCGKPIIITKQCGIAELLENGREGLLLNSPEQIDPGVNFIRELLANSSLKETISHNARRTAEKLSSEIYAENLTNVYHHAANIPWSTHIS